jgi:hypothetical protein
MKKSLKRTVGLLPLVVAFAGMANAATIDISTLLANPLYMRREHSSGIYGTARTFYSLRGWTCGRQNRPGRN